MVSSLRLWRAGIALCLLAAGVALSTALRHGLYANAVLACGTALWLSLLSLRQDAPLPRTPGPVGAEALAAETELRRLRFMLDHAPVPLVVLSAEGQPYAINRAARRLFGADDRITQDGGVLSAAIATARPGQRALVKLSDRPDGPPTRSFALAVAHWSSAEGPATLAALVDIEAELQAAEAAALRELLQTLSHEIMNSLTPIMSLAESARLALAEDGVAGLAPGLDALETIARRARGLDRFVQGYRSLARVPAPVRVECSIALLLGDISRLAAPGHRRPDRCRSDLPGADGTAHERRRSRPGGPRPAAAGRAQRRRRGWSPVVPCLR
jgi:signal transduction histidine kinase